MHARAYRILLPLLTVALSAGCLSHQREHDIVRFWFDYNTLSAPALFLDQEDHKPYRSSRVGYFAWMYGKDPGHQNAYVKARKEWEKLVDEKMEQAGQEADSVYKAQLARKKAEECKTDQTSDPANAVPPSPEGNDSEPSLGPEGSPIDVPLPDAPPGTPAARTVPTSLQLPTNGAPPPTTVLSVYPQPRNGLMPSQARGGTMQSRPSRPIGRPVTSPGVSQPAAQSFAQPAGQPAPTTTVASQPSPPRQPVAVTAPLPLTGPATGWMPQPVPIPSNAPQFSATQRRDPNDAQSTGPSLQADNTHTPQPDPNSVALAPRAVSAPRQNRTAAPLPAENAPPESAGEMAGAAPYYSDDEYPDEDPYRDAEGEDMSADEYAAIPDSLMDLPPLDEPAEGAFDEPADDESIQPGSVSESKSRLPQWTSVPHRPFDFLPQNTPNDTTRLKFRRLSESENRQKNMWDRSGQRYSAGIAAGWQSLD